MIANHSNNAVIRSIWYHSLLLRSHLKTPSCACLPVGRDGDERCVCQRQKKTNQMLKQVQHDKMVRFRSCCHPGPCPELDSGLFRDLDFRFREFGG
jgi:hypothetical protein